MPKYLVTYDQIFRNRIGEEVEAGSAEAAERIITNREEFSDIEIADVDLIDETEAAPTIGKD